MKKVKAYLANQLGFSETGKYILENLIIPKVNEIGITINDPFRECEKELDSKHLDKLEKYEDVRNYWDEFNSKVAPINNALMQNSDCQLAILDGGHAVDDGVSSEVGYYAAMKRGPIFALRSDIRRGENLATSINLQLRGYIVESGGKLVEAPDPEFKGEKYPVISTWLSEVRKWSDGFREKR
jgi:hypothetical protein